MSHELFAGANEVSGRVKGVCSGNSSNETYYGLAQKMRVVATAACASKGHVWQVRSGVVVSAVIRSGFGREASQSGKVVVKVAVLRSTVVVTQSQTRKGNRRVKKDTQNGRKYRKNEEKGGYGRWCRSGRGR